MMIKHSVFDKLDTNEQKNFLVHVLENEPPYKAIKFDYNWYIRFGLIEKISVDAFCQNCDSEKVFSDEIKDYLHELLEDSFRSTGHSPGSSAPATNEFYNDKEYFVNITLHCAKCGEAHYYSLLFKGDTVTKIGQHPSFTKISAQDLKKYKNLISKYYPELTKSVNAYSQGMGVAAFVYLRRILEYIVESKFTGDMSWKFIEKLKEVEKSEPIIPAELEEIKAEIYSVLSKGVHEYEEDECMQLYLSVKFIIERMLDLELEKKQNSDKAKAAIKAIKGKLQGEKQNG